MKIKPELQVWLAKEWGLQLTVEFSRAKDAKFQIIIRGCLIAVSSYLTLTIL